MRINIYEDEKALGQGAGAEAAALLRSVLQEKGLARMVLATGASQFATLKQLIQEPGIEWNRVELFHLDEYIGIPIDHPASFRRYIRERVISQLPPVHAVHYINGQADPATECWRLGKLLESAPVDITLAGIGENGHLAFNDPPADFYVRDAYIVVNLEETCRKQQLNEGWFDNLASVPAQAISMSIHQLMRSNTIICSVPDNRKAMAVYNCLEQDISPLYPASVLRKHPDCRLYLDRQSAALLSTDAIARFQTIVQ